MEKFSYGLEFYKNNIYKLEDTNLFKRKVKEAEKIEKVLFNTIPNIELVRKYVLRSYYFDKKITFEDRIDFINDLFWQIMSLVIKMLLSFVKKYKTR